MARERRHIAMLMGAAQRLRRCWWRTARSSASGVQAIVVTAEESRIVLVRHTYSAGWHLPGGELKRRESPHAAVLRELREEIGLVSFASVEALEPTTLSLSGRSVTLHLFVVRGARYVPSRNWEIAEIREVPPGACPEDAAVARRLLAQAGFL